MNVEALDRALARVPQYMADLVREYLNEGVPPGRFLRAVLEDDLHRVCLLADKGNQAALFNWGCILDALPLNVWGSAGKVDEHLARHRNPAASPAE